MLNISPDILNFIGNTPLIELKQHPSPNKIYIKFEGTNPTGSIKDRVAVSIINEAERNGYLNKNTIILENTSGNMGTSLAMVAGLKRYHCIFTLTDKVSIEKRRMMNAFGAEIIEIPDGTINLNNGHNKYIEELTNTIKNVYFTDQYNNPQNINVHYQTTGPEIWHQTKGKIDILIAGAGTGGTISGAGRFLKQMNSKIKIIAVDPIGSVYYDLFYHNIFTQAAKYMTEGIGEDYLCKSMDLSIIDEIIQVSDKDAFLTARQIAKDEGIFAGGSSGGALWAALHISSTVTRNKNIVVIFPDSGYKYLSKIYNDDWMAKNGFL